MENTILKDIIRYVADRLNINYGFCGVAEGEDMAIINSSDGKGNDIIINIKIKPE